LRNTAGQTPLNLLGVPATPKTDVQRAMVDLLRDHGGLDELTELPPDSQIIRVWRRGQLTGQTVFQKGTNWPNQFTLMEAFLDVFDSPNQVHAVPYALPPNVSPEFQDRLRRMINNRRVPDGFEFPDLTRITVHRLGPNQTYQKVALDLSKGPEDVDCSKDISLEFGDVIEIPKRTHSLSEFLVGLTPDQEKHMRDCRTNDVYLNVDGHQIRIPLPAGQARYLDRILQTSEARALLKSTSNLSRVRVVRVRAPQGAPHEFLVDTTIKADGFNDLLLEPDDIIDVPSL
jgi:hypothetical protein